MCELLISHFGIMLQFFKSQAGFDFYQRFATTQKQSKNERLQRSHT